MKPATLRSVLPFLLLLFLFDRCAYNDISETPSTFECSTVSYNNDIKPILLSSCVSSGCHNANSPNGDWTSFNAVKNKAVLIKSRTGDRSMPAVGSLTQQQIQKIACWVDAGALSN